MRRVISVTRRYIDFLFNREETVVCRSCELPGIGDSCDCRCHTFRPSNLIDDTELQLPPSDESKVGQD